MQFLSRCGENIVISPDRRTATWKFQYTGGISFSSEPLQTDEILELTLSETGHVQLGLIYRNPTELESVRAAYEKEIKIITDVRVHKKQCKISVQLTETPTNEYQVDFKHSGNVQIKKIGPRKDVWLVVHLQFGTVKTTLDQTRLGSSTNAAQPPISRCDMVFHDIKGENIKRSSNGKEVSLREGNLASACCLSLVLCPGKVVGLDVCPVTTDGREAKKFGVKIGCTQKDPASFEDLASRFLIVRDKTPADKPWQNLVRIEKTGNISIQNLGNNELLINDDAYTMQTPTDDVKGVCIILELFRAKVTILRFEDIDSSASGISEYEEVTHRIESKLEAVENALESNDSQMVDYSNLKLGELKKDIEDAYCTMSQPSNSTDDSAARTDADPYIQSPGVRRHGVEHLYQTIKRIGTSLQQHIEKDNKFKSADSRPESAVEICSQIRTMLEKILQNQPSPNTEDATSKSAPTITDIRGVLQRNFKSLVRDLDLPDLMDHLYQNNVISRDKFEHLREIYKRDKREARREFLLMFTGSLPFDVDLFCQAFKDSNQEWLLNKRE